ncbi:UNVERIFIED_CONTAM: hypothetical protein DES50_102663 [Williamsia faeni]
MRTQLGSGQTFQLDRPWQALAPFLFATRHVDNYPKATAEMTPDASLAGHSLGSDFGNPEGWSMYHGQTVPGFPAHPHRGFETITIVTRGFVDHADSTGAAARYGVGDVQWLTAGNGVSHSEMFPLLDEDHGNPFELFQIWLNLAAVDKKAAPEFTMLWNEDIPVVEVTGPDGGTARIKIIAGRFGDTEPLAAPSSSWAARTESDVAVWMLDLEPHARVELPAATRGDARRVLYVYGDDSAAVIDGNEVADGVGYAQTSPGTTVVGTGDSSARLLLLQAVPIGEPVAQHGPFVMNTREEIVETYDDYQRTQFGGWPWDRADVVHPKSETRFARHTDGRLERPEPQAF